MRTAATLPLAALCLLSCRHPAPDPDPAAQLFRVYRDAEPANELFVRTHQLAHLGDSATHRFVYHDFTWSGARNATRGTQQVLVFDHADRYLGRVLLHTALDPEACRVIGDRLHAVSPDGQYRDIHIHDATPPPRRS